MSRFLFTLAERIYLTRKQKSDIVKKGKTMNFEDICLLVLVLQGFVVTWYEYRVYKIHNDRFKERKQWRAAKEKAKLKKIEVATITTADNSELPSKTTTGDSPNKTSDAPVVGSIRKTDS